MASPWVPVEDRPASIQTEMIQRLLKEGIQFYKGDEDARALVMFKKAYVLSVSLQEPLTQARCLLNLGAAYITAGKLKKALKCLHRCKETGAMEKDGDLSFNIAAVYDNLREYTTAARFYRKAIGEYGKSRTRSTADAHIKLAYCLVSREDWASAAQSFQLAGDAYRKAQQWEDAAMAMREAANYLLRNPKYCSEDVLETLQACSQLCTEITSQELLGKLNNHLGLHYASMGCFALAEKHFTQAMNLCAGECFSIRKRAVLLQNLGAVYSALDQYGRSLEYHSQAADIYGELGERKSEAQCLYNLATAYRQLNNYDAAEFYYRQTLKAFGDIGDLYGEAQVCEGLGDAHLHLGRFDQATYYYKQSLGQFAKSKEPSEIARERIQAKLADVCQQAKLQDRISHTDC